MEGDGLVWASHALGRAMASCSSTCLSFGGFARTVGCCLHCSPLDLPPSCLRYGAPANTSLRTVHGTYHTPDFDPEYKN